MDWQILFPGLSSFLLLEPHVLLLRLALICVGCFLVYMGYKDKLDPMLMIPLGFSMAVVNAGVLIMDDNSMANLFVSPLSSGPERLLQDLQIYFLQPVYNFAFANGLIACLIFMSIGANADLDYFIARPFLSLFWLSVRNWAPS
jgi:oxaloacetate decarboxylase beta subunit